MIFKPYKYVPRRVCLVFFGQQKVGEICEIHHITFRVAHGRRENAVQDEIGDR